MRIYCKGAEGAAAAAAKTKANSSTNCDQCSRCFTSGVKLRKHVGDAHPRNTKLLCCNKCRRKCASVSARKCHEKNCKVNIL